MTPEELQIHGKLKSRMWRLSNLYWIQDEQGRKVKFSPNWAQKAFLLAMWWLNVILKARQLGMSTLMAVFILDTCLFGRDKTCGVIDKTDADAVKKLKKIRFAYDNLDCADQDPNGIPSTQQLGSLIKRTVVLNRANDHELEFSNSSQVWAGTSLRGNAIQVLHVSELGYIAMNFPKRAEEIRAGSFNTVHKGCIIVIESTHEGGKVGLNYEMIVVSQESPADLGELDWKFHFFAWWQDPKYSLKPRPITDQVMVKYFADLIVEHGIHLTEGQKSWYVAKQRVQKEAMKKEYPSTPDEAVNAVIKGAIYGDWITRARSSGRVCEFNLAPGYPIYTSWDLGVSDFTDIWFIQPVGIQHRVFDFYENNGMSTAHYVEYIRAWERKHGVTISGHLLPHDAGSRQIGISGEGGVALSPIQQIDSMGLKNCFRVPRIPDEWDGIDRTRDLMDNMVFHSVNLSKDRINGGRRYPSGLGALEAFRTQNDSTNAVIKEKPLHDESSHAAAGLRTYAEAHAAGVVSPYVFNERKGAAKVTVSKGVRQISDNDFDEPRVTTNFRKIRVRK